jgi:sugar lactone lactonase YvrE
MRLTLVLPLRNQAALTILLNQLYDPSSPYYHKYLSVAQFAEQFGPTEEDYQAVVSFAKSNGFIVTGSPANRLIVPVSGTVAQVQKVFNVHMDIYKHPTENRNFFSPDREPSFNLSVPIAHIAQMNNFSVPRPMLEKTQEGRVLANVTGSGPGGSYLGSDMRAAYYGGTTLTGNGQILGILEFGGYLLNDVNLTFSEAGQSYDVPIENVLIDGATAGANSDDSEQVLDIVQAIGMAPGLSQVRVYIGNDGDDADILNAMATENLAKQLSISWNWRPDDPTTDDVFFQEFAAQGQTAFVASGDNGAYDATLSPFFYPAEDAYVTTVGATHLTTTGAAGAWVSETAWNSLGHGSGGGISPDGIPIPTWQAAAVDSSNGGSTTLRNVPDVAMEGDYDNFYCHAGVCAGGGAGTSFAAPRWAGFMALVNQQAVEAGNAPLGGIGFINPAIYAIGGGSSYTVDYHDITSGNNDTDSQPLWYNAVPGYDLVTGWGSPTGQSLIDALAGPAIPGFWLATSSPELSITQGTVGTTTITVIDTGGFTGNVNLAVSGLPDGVSTSFNPQIASGTSVLTLSVSGTATIGNATLTITGTSGSLSASTNILLTITPPVIPAPPIGQFGTQSIGSASSPATLTLTFGAPGTLSSIAVLTQGIANLDFTNSGGGSCAIGTSYAAGATCTVNVAFAPRYAGTRYGAVVLDDAGGANLGQMYIQGVGLGSEAVFSPGTQSTIGNGFVYPEGVAIDGNGNVYVTDYGNQSSGGGTPGALYSEMLLNGVYTQTRINCAFITPVGVALDGGGNIYVTDPSTPAVYKITQSNGNCTETLIGSGFGTPWGVAVDGSGSVYIADFGTSSIPAAVYKETLEPDGSYAQSTIGNSWVTPVGVAVDTSGNVYVADYSIPGVFVVAPSGSSYGQTANPIGSGWVAPAGIAVDGNGNVYVSDVGNLNYFGGNARAAVYKEALFGGNYIQTQIGSGWVAPYGVAVHGSGNVFVADEAIGVYENDLADPPTMAFASTAAGTISTDSPKTVTISNLGNTALEFSEVNYPADFPEAAVGTPGDCTSSTSLAEAQDCTLNIKFKPTATIGSNSSLVLNESVTLTTNTLNTTATVQQVAVSGTEVLPTGSLVLTVSPDPGTVGTQITFMAYVTGTGAGPIPTGTVTFYSDGSALGAPVTLSNGVATYLFSSASIGSYTVSATYSGDSNYIGANSNIITENVIALPGVAGFEYTNVGTDSVGSTSTVIPLSIAFNTGDVLGSISVLTQGAANMDFANASGGTCTLGTAYLANATCSVNVTFTPKYAGTRYGAVILADNNGNTLGIGYLQGMGVGPQTAFLPGMLTALASGFGYPQGIAVDGNGNVYIADAGYATVFEVTQSSGSVNYTTIGSGFSEPDGVAVDGGGNVYIADSGTSAVYKETLSNGSYTQTAIGYGFSAPQGIAVDGEGNVYIADYGNGIEPGAVYMETLSNGSYAQSIIGSGLVSPQSVAVDGNGNVYVADSANGNGSAAVYRLTLSNGSYIQSVIGSGWVTPNSVALDGSGNVYVTDNNYGLGSGFVNMETLQSNGSYIQTTLINSASIPYPGGVVVDGRRNLYVSDNFAGTVYSEDFADPPILSFATTPFGSISSDSPEAVTMENVGNAPLVFPAPISGTNPNISTSFSLDNSTTCPQIGVSGTAATLNAGISCVYAIDFIPAAIGSITGSLNMTNNALNSATASQTIALSGSATVASQTIAFGTIATQTVGTALTLTAKASSGLAVSYTATPSTVCTVSSTTATFIAAGTCSITASQAGNSNYAAATPVTQSFTVNAALQSQTITFAPPTSPVTYGVSPIALVATASSRLPVSFSVLSGPGTVSGSTLTVTGVGTIVVAANQAGNSTYAAAPQVTQSIVVNQASQTITFGTIATQTVGTALTLTAKASSGLAVSYTATPSTVCTVSSTTATFIAAGTCSITASQAGNSHYAAATPVTQSFTVNAALQSQTITFAPPTSPVTYGVSPIALVATASSRLPVSFSVLSGPGTVSGSTLTVTGVGTIVVAANQAGNSTYAAAPQVTQSIVVNQASQTITFGTIATQTVGTALTLTAKASSGLAVSYTATPSTVCTVSSTTATFIAAGTCSITASQAGNSNYAAATPVTQSFTVNAAPPTVTLEFASTQLVYPGATTVTACVASPSNVTATGNISISDGSTLLTRLTLGNIGCATWYISPGLSAGTHIIRAIYSGDSKNSPGTSAPTTLTVSPVPVNMSVSCWNSSFSFGGNFQCTVNASSNGGTPQGSVTYALDGGSTVSVLLSTGSAQFTLTRPNAGTHHVVISFAQQTNYAAASPQTESFTVVPAAVNVALTPSSYYVSSGTNVSFTTVVTSSSAGSPDATGTVSFYNGATLLATIPVNANGKAVYSTASLSVGNHTITATYAGAANYGSGSSTATITVH